MKAILITSPVHLHGETETIREVFSEGLDILHVRKPGLDGGEMERFMNTIPDDLMAKVAIHGHPELAKKFGARGIHLPSTAPVEMLNGWSGTRSRSAHSVQEIADQADVFDYFFLSPVFDSISKEGYKSNFSHGELQWFLHRPRKYEVIALGGVEEQNADRAMELGFDGVALLGAVWKYDDMADRIRAFKGIMEKCRKKTGTY